MDIKEIQRHEPYDECDGIPLAFRGEDFKRVFGDEAESLLRGTPRCYECGIALCSCEYAYGHDCEG